MFEGWDPASRMGQENLQNLFCRKRRKVCQSDRSTGGNVQHKNRGRIKDWQVLLIFSLK